VTITAEVVHRDFSMLIPRRRVFPSYFTSIRLEREFYEYIVWQEENQGPQRTSRGTIKINT